ncbi:hypothetical protein BCR43DRAFT_490085 [Syncephalastrum racemosum]|uniref:Roadblock/LAMTOR2 domain-containing protein n=1 Tax=Syncephalastrum racemosum TaxID=13706 RepID=A0A1X2HFE1_SYNRA|nr:hypothetical protein BCR43DRAFT_490085 [Syncephalastrum racemosum]
MLKPKIISQVLQQATHNGVTTSLLMTNEGSLLAFAAEHGRSAKTIAAIAANIWSTYKQQSEQNNNLRNIIVECEEGVVYVTNIGAMLLCLAGDTSVELGLLKAKADAIARHLEEPLSRIPAFQPEYAM